MANVKSFPNNKDEYIGAEYVMKWLHGRTSGVFASENNAAVSAVQNEMAVNVSDGLGWMANAGKDGIVWWNDHEAVNGTKLKLSIDAADGTLNRIDRIIVAWKTTNYVDLPEIKVLKGSLASDAVAPDLTNNSTVRQISLAQVYVAAGTTAITASMITDERLDASVCGLVTENINIDTSVMQNQFEALLNSIQKELQELNSGTVVLLKTGDTMQGTLDMGGNKIQNVATPENESDAVNKKFVDDTLSNFETGVYNELLWENASPTSAFAGQTIPLDLSKYDAVRVVYYNRSAVPEKNIPEMYTFSSVIDIGDTEFSVMCRHLGKTNENSSVEWYARLAEVTSEHVRFDDARYMNNSSVRWSGTESADVAIPIKIYGIRGGTA